LFVICAVGGGLLASFAIMTGEKKEREEMSKYSAELGLVSFFFALVTTGFQPGLDAFVFLIAGILMGIGYFAGPVSPTAHT